MSETVTSGSPDGGAMMNTTDWQARAGHIREVLLGAPDTAVAAALGAFLFSDDGGKTWTYNGAVWMSWDGTQWSEGPAPANLHLQPFLREPEPAAEAEPAATVVTPMGTTLPAEPVAEVKADDKKADDKKADDTKGEVKKADDKKSDDTTADEPAVDAAPAIELPAMADSHPMAEVAMSGDKPQDTNTTELAADKAEATVREAAPMSASAGATAADAASAATADVTATAATAPSAAASAAPAATPATAAGTTFRPTHSVPMAGMGAWTRPDPSVRPEYQLAPRTELMVTEMLSSGWAHVAGSNGWTGWVDGRQLVSAQAAAPAIGQPTPAQPAPMAQSTPMAQPAPMAQPTPQPAAQWQPAQAAQPAQPAQPMQQPAQQWQPAQPAQPMQQAQQWQPSQPAQPMQSAPAAQPMQPAPAAQPAPAQQAPAQPAPAPAGQPGQPTFRPTHAVPPMGLPAWPQPNPALPPQATLGGGTQLMVAEWSQSGWARVVASNGWSGWVDGRMLVPIGQTPYQR